jgi:hypothetical protein
MTLSDREPTRKQRFNAALDLAGITREDWRTKVFPIGNTHLNEVLNGERPGGAELNAAIDALIARYLPTLVAPEATPRAGEVVENAGEDVGDVLGHEAA